MSLRLHTLLACKKLVICMFNLHTTFFSRYYVYSLVCVDKRQKYIQTKITHNKKLLRYFIKAKILSLTHYFIPRIPTKDKEMSQVKLSHFTFVRGQRARNIFKKKTSRRGAPCFILRSYRNNPIPLVIYCRLPSILSRANGGRPYPLSL